MNITRRIAIALGLSGAAAAQAQTGKKVYSARPKQPGIPLYSEATAYGNMVFISGHGVAEGNVKEQTRKVLDQIQAALEAAGSSMQKVLKANVYLQNIDDYAAMNDEYRGRFGPEPPVRTTVAVAAIPLKGCLVEIDVIAHR